MDLLRPARLTEVVPLNELISVSARALSRGFYTAEQTELLIRHVFGVDSQLVFERAGRLVACGGWSGRRTLFGGDQAKDDEDPRLVPGTEGG